MTESEEEQVSVLREINEELEEDKEVWRLRAEWLTEALQVREQQINLFMLGHEWCDSCRNDLEIRQELVFSDEHMKAHWMEPREG